MRSSTIMLLLVSAIVVACSGTEEKAPQDGADMGDAPSEEAPRDAGDAGRADADALTVEGVGDRCAAGCAGSDECIVSTDQCASGYCYFGAGQSGDPDSYCTGECSDAACPEGYTCGTVAESPLAVACIADPPVCGDGIVQRGELCDDGNTTPRDGCSADCSELEYPPPFARLEFTILDVAVDFDFSYEAEGESFEVDGEWEEGRALDCSDATILGGVGGGFVRVAGRACSPFAELTLPVTLEVGSHPVDGSHQSRSGLCVQLNYRDEQYDTFCTAPWGGSVHAEEWGEVTIDELTFEGAGARGTFEGRLYFKRTHDFSDGDNFWDGSKSDWYVDVEGTFDVLGYPVAQ